MENQIVIQSPAGNFQAYISRPSKFPAPAIVVLQELFGGAHYDAAAATLADRRTSEFLNQQLR